MQADTAGNDMFGRRVLFAGLFAATMAGSLALAALALSPGGIGLIDVTLLALFAMTLPWMVVGILERRDRLSDHALFRRSDRGGDADGDATSAATSR